MRRSLALAVVLSALALPSSARADGLPPTITHEAVTHAELNASIVFRARIEDPDAVFAPTLYYRYVGGDSSYAQLPLVRNPPSEDWIATVNASGEFEYWMEAYDELGNGPARVGDPAKPLRVQIGSPAVAAGGKDALSDDVLLSLPPDEKTGYSTPTLVGGGLLIGAVVAAVVGTVSTMSTLSAADRWKAAGTADAWSKESEAVRSGATTSNVSWGVAGAFAAVGAALVVAGQF